MRRRRASGFTIIEIMIAMGVITIAIMGTVAAIGFGLRASDLGRTNTFAIGVNRKVMELILGGNYQLPNVDFEAGALTTAQLTAPHLGAPWRPLYFQGAAIVPTWFKIADYGFTDLNAPEAQRFLLESPNYELHVFMHLYGTVTTHPDIRLREILITTRWRDKTGWKNIRTQAFN